MKINKISDQKTLKIPGIMIDAKKSIAANSVSSALIYGIIGFPLREGSIKLWARSLFLTLFRDRGVPVFHQSILSNFILMEDDYYIQKYDNGDVATFGVTIDMQEDFGLEIEKDSEYFILLSARQLQSRIAHVK